MARLHRPSTTTGTPNEAPASPGEIRRVQVTAAPMRPRRSPRLVAAGTLLACLGGLGGAAVYQRAAHSNDVVVVAHSVARGETISAADLSTVTIGPAPGVHTVPASSLRSLVGKQALVDLPAGSLVGAETVGTATLAQGTVQLGLKLLPGRVPNQAMPPGTPVELVEVSDGKTPGTAALMVEATLITSPQVLADGSTRAVDVAVPQQQAQRLADLAAHDLLVMVRKAGG